MHSYCWENGETISLPQGKVVCVGRNYIEHAKELNNPVPKEPILFMKPKAAMENLATHAIHWPEGYGECHVETELAILINAPLNKASPEQAMSAICGVGLGLDLTLRELQQKLKDQGQPWEKAKAFNASNPLTAFIKVESVTDLNALSFTLYRNQQLQQHGIARDMIFGIVDLLVYISQWFELSPGDVVMTGTPAGVGALKAGDELVLTLKHYEHTQHVCRATVRGASS